MTSLVGTNRADFAHGELARRILLRQIPQGRPLVEERLAEDLDVSRTPLREALLRLTGDGLLVKRGRYWAVPEIGAAQYFQGMQVRRLLEPEAAALAAGRVPRSEGDALAARIDALAAAVEQVETHWAADDALHGLVAQASGNVVLADAIRRARVPTRLFELTNPFDRVAADAREHLRILNGVMAGDAKGARTAMRQHLDHLERSMLGMVRGRHARAIP